MKNLSIIFSLFALMTFSITNAQKRYLSGTDIPKEIRSYVTNNFPDAEIRKVKEEREPLKTEYEVKLTPKAELEFDGEFNITEIESKSGIPANTLPEKIKSYLTENHQGVKAKEWKLKSGGQKVKLVDGTKLYFDENGTYAGQK